MLKIKIVPEAMQEIQRLSAFKKFEAESCQLQRIELNNLNVNERIVLFVNAFNTLMIHSCIVKGNPGANLLERTAFLRSARYNIGGHIFSLLDVRIDYYLHLCLSFCAIIYLFILYLFIL